MSVFWDSSALIHLLCDQGQSESARSFLRANPKMVVWWGSVGECAAAIGRLEREESIRHDQANVALKALAALRNTWHEVMPSELLLQKMMRLPRLHSLRSEDAFQLAAALIAADERIAELGFLTFDAKLKEAAAKEGFSVTAFTAP